jgi:hypothetical protein
MTLPASKKNIAVHSNATVEDPARRSEPQGWDPFEVWRTRILLPRLAEAAAEHDDPTVTPAQLLRR